jgi:opacity protein-like surface antigen
MQEGQSSFSGLALRTRIHSDQLIEGITLMPTIEWWRSSNTIQPFGIEASRKDATLEMDARYDFKRQGFRPYVGAGLGMHFLSSKVNAPSLGLRDASNSLIKGGVAALAGVTFGLAGKVDNFIELKYHHIPDYRQLKLNWGLAYNF